MNKRVQNQKPSYQFSFNEIEKDYELEKNANLGLVKLLTLAPPKARAAGVLQRDGVYYVSAVEVFSPYRSFEEKAYGLTPGTAVRKVLDKLEDRLYRWRFGGSDNGSTPYIYQTT